MSMAVEELAPQADPALRENAPSPQSKAPPGLPRALLVIVLAGALVRLALWGWFWNVPPHIWDEKDYNVLAINLVRHGEFSFTPGEPTSIRPPLYPAVVAGVYSLLG